MRRFVEEADRGQWTLLPECLDDLSPRCSSSAYNLTLFCTIVDWVISIVADTDRPWLLTDSGCLHGQDP